MIKTINTIADQLGAWSFGYAISTGEQFEADIRNSETKARLVWDSFLLLTSIPCAIASLVLLKISVWTTPFKGCHILKTESSPQTEDKEGEVHVSTWNINCIPFSKVLNNTASMENRVTAIANYILQLETPIVFVQEAYGNTPYKLRELLTHKFPTILDRMGIRAVGLDSGLACYTTLPVLDYEYIPFKEDREDRPFMSHGFLAVKTASTLYIGTHLSSGDEKGELRFRQFAQIRNYVKAQKEYSHFVIAGDLNIGENKTYPSKEYQSLNLEELDVASKKQRSKETCTDELKVGKENATCTRDDYILSSQKYKFSKLFLTNPKELSDHYALTFYGANS